jgi:hypothetical protein
VRLERWPAPGTACSAWCRSTSPRHGRYGRPRARSARLVPARRYRSNVAMAHQVLDLCAQRTFVKLDRARCASVEMNVRG